MTDDFRYYLKVRYGECDAQKVVFNARYGDYVDLAVTEFLRVLNLPTADGHGFDYQVVKLTIDWKASARFRDVLELAVSTTQVGNTSFTVGVDFRIAGEEAVIARGEVTGVAVDRALTKQRITPEMREILTRGAPGVLVDHADYLPRVNQTEDTEPS